MDSYILGIETSCDETSAAVVKNGREVLSNVISSQIEIHKVFGGVVPEVASRKHLENIIPVIDRALKGSGIRKEQLTAIGVTNQPGLIGALLVGVTGAKGLAISLGVPLIPVHHLRGHIYANLLENELAGFPALALIVSGGHTTLSIWHGHDRIEVVGRTMDDAAGEAFDKIARKLGLSYPGGPVIEELARKGMPGKVSFSMNKSASTEGYSLDFSYSGLKTKVINYLSNAEARKESIVVEDVCWAVQDAIVESIVGNVLKAVRRYGIYQLVLGGGVTSNGYLIERLKAEGDKMGLKVYHPSKILCTDNGVMIAVAAYHLQGLGRLGDLSMNAYPNAEIV